MHRKLAKMFPTSLKLHQKSIPNQRKWCPGAFQKRSGQKSDSTTGKWSGGRSFWVAFWRHGFPKSQICVPKSTKVVSRSAPRRTLGADRQGSIRPLNFLGCFWRHLGDFARHFEPSCESEFGSRSVPGVEKGERGKQNCLRFANPADPFVNSCVSGFVVFIEFVWKFPVR